MGGTGHDDSLNGFRSISQSRWVLADYQRSQSRNVGCREAGPAGVVIDAATDTGRVYTVAAGGINLAAHAGDVRLLVGSAGVGISRVHKRAEAGEDVVSAHPGILIEVRPDRDRVPAQTWGGDVLGARRTRAIAGRHHDTTPKSLHQVVNPATVEVRLTIRAVAAPAHVDRVSAVVQRPTGRVHNVCGASKGLEVGRQEGASGNTPGAAPPPRMRREDHTSYVGGVALNIFADEAVGTTRSSRYTGTPVGRVYKEGGDVVSPIILVDGDFGAVAGRFRPDEGIAVRGRRVIVVANEILRDGFDRHDAGTFRERVDLARVQLSEEYWDKIGEFNGCPKSPSDIGSGSLGGPHLRFQRIGVSIWPTRQGARILHGYPDSDGDALGAIVLETVIEDWFNHSESCHACLSLFLGRDQRIDNLLSRNIKADTKALTVRGNDFEFGEIHFGKWQVGLSRSDNLKALNGNALLAGNVIQCLRREVLLAARSEHGKTDHKDEYGDESNEPLRKKMAMTKVSHGDPPD